MQGLKRSGASCALVLAAVCGGANAGEIVGNFTNATTAKGWSITSERNYNDSLENPHSFPTMPGTGWLNLLSDPANTQFAYATSTTTLDTRLPIRIRYDYLSRTTFNIEGGTSGFHLLDPAKSPDLHTRLEQCSTPALLVAFSYESMLGATCSGPHSLNQFNRVAVRSGNAVLAYQQAPMWLNCGNYNWHGSRVAARDCATRDQAVAIGMVRAVDATLTPKGAGYTLDLSIDGQPIYTQLAVDTTLPTLVRFGLWADSRNDPHIEVRNVRVTQVTMLASEVNDRCMDVQTIGGVLELVAATCSGAPTQILRMDGQLFRVGSTCLTVHADGTRITSELCRGATTQRWELLDGGRIKHRVMYAHTSSPGKCITLGANGTSLSLQACDDTLVAQTFHPIAP